MEQNIEKNLPKTVYAILTPQGKEITTVAGMKDNTLPPQEQIITIINYNYRITTNVPYTDDDCAEILTLANKLLEAKKNLENHPE